MNFSEDADVGTLDAFGHFLVIRVVGYDVPQIVVAVQSFYKARTLVLERVDSVLVLPADAVADYDVAVKEGAFHAVAVDSEGCGCGGVFP